jgi:translation initiation factor 2B subunit (eIF-2B alpha/beta/delta family)
MHALALSPPARRFVTRPRTPTALVPAEFIAANVARRVSRFVIEEADKRAAASASSSATAAGARSAAEGLSAGVAGGVKGASAELATVTLTVGRSASSDDHATAGSLGAASGLGRASTSGSGGVSAEASVAEAGGAAAAPAGSAAPASGAAGVAAVADVRSACADALSRWRGQQQGQQLGRAGTAATDADGTGARGSSSSSGDSSSAGKHASGGRYGDMAFAAIRGGVLDALNELHDELDSASATLCASASDLLSHGDVVLVAGYDAAVRDFLLAAAKRRRIAEVIVCEAADAAPLPAPSTSAPGAGSSAGAPAPIFPGQALALELTGRAKPLPVTVIPDADAAAVIHRVHKVVLGARGVTADGAVAADAPAFLLALAAGGAVPVIVLANALRVSRRRGRRPICVVSLRVRYAAGVVCERGARGVRECCGPFAGAAQWQVEVGCGPDGVLWAGCEG